MYKKINFLFIAVTLFCLSITNPTAQQTNIAPSAVLAGNIVTWYSGVQDYDKIVDGNISTQGSNDYAVHPMTTNHPDTPASIAFYFDESYTTFG